MTFHNTSQSHQLAEPFSFSFFHVFFTKRNPLKASKIAPVYFLIYFQLHHWILSSRWVIAPFFCCHLCLNRSFGCVSSHKWMTDNYLQALKLNCLLWSLPAAEPDGPGGEDARPAVRLLSAAAAAWAARRPGAPAGRLLSRPRLWTSGPPEVSNGNAGADARRNGRHAVRAAGELVPSFVPALTKRLRWSVCFRTVSLSASPAPHRNKVDSTGRTCWTIDWLIVSFCCFSWNAFCVWNTRF